MRVFQAKAGEQDFRRTVGDVIVVAVRIKEEIGRIKNIDATAPFHSGSGDVETLNEGFVLIVGAITVCVFVDGNMIGTDDVIRRRGRDFVVDCAPVAIVAEDFETGRGGILEVLHDPEAATFVEVEENGLAYEGFSQHLFEFEIVGSGE